MGRQQRELSGCCQNCSGSESRTEPLIWAISEPFRKACVTDRYPGTRKGEKHLPGQEGAASVPGIAAPRHPREPALPPRNQRAFPAQQPGDPCERCPWAHPARAKGSRLSLRLKNTFQGLRSGITPGLGCGLLLVPLSCAVPVVASATPGSPSASRTFPRSVLGFWGVRLRALDNSKSSQLRFHPVCLESPGVCLVRPRPGQRRSS